ncbi:hypothetical protein CGRA01v4_10430 [Colletotrichum graminicola]|uniref:Uncharacterized protein n=1 Tax=Colletotrichum graminicola (strain M1.001 / M2 / FGSC 10212) TaxID=645133 RepID=E3R027_COLGM|nr:uncharacterized protein GLRG_11592 [Colletotrichum graminicola M1.001]EFQ36447.1 hypothetical protein GLRG_11592 [Colletotrichum graminicola M1.001]WDK19143.1 hypothetical protein CGRA01v4_10430 [Colletotrichum graminicola]
MISITLLGPLGVLLAGASSAVAFDRISIQSTVKADTEVEVTIRNDIADGASSFDAGFTNYNVYLATTPPGWGTGPVCLLANGTKIDVTSVKVKIPADAVPDSADLMITTMEWNSDPTKDGPSGFEYSNEFTFSGGAGEWSKTELAGHSLGEMDMLPCSAYACARKCNDQYFEERDTTSDDLNVYKNTYECVAACPGTTFPSWDSVINDVGGSGGDPSGTASVPAASATASTTTAAPSSSNPASSSQSGSSPSETPNAGSRLAAETLGLTAFGLATFYGLF